MVKKDILWPGGPSFYYDTDLFPPGTDSFALAYFARPVRSERVCDLGSGTGLLPALLLSRDDSLQIEAVELSAQASALAHRTFEENGWEEKITFHIGDLRQRSNLPRSGSIDYVISNPPYFPCGSGASAKGTARQCAREETSCTLADLCAAAKYVLRYGGRFALVHRPERLADLLCTMREHGMEPKRLRFLEKSVGSTPSLVFIEGKRGGKSGLIIEPPLVIGSSEWERVYFRAP